MPARTTTNSASTSTDSTSAIQRCRRWVCSSSWKVRRLRNMITNTNSTMMAPGVDQDLHHGQEVGLGEEEDGGHVEEREHQQQQGVDHVLAGDGAQAADHGQDREDR